jgi:RimJ/RimL family protein N-acetyltransferase
MAAVPQTLRTPRLTLRPLRPDDREAVARGVGNYDVAHWLAVVPYPYGLAEADTFIDEVRAAGKRVWAICDGEGLQGVVGLEAQLGCWLARPAWGRGYASEACGIVVWHAFTALNEGSVESYVFEGNDRSHRVLTKLGFRETGRRKVESRALAQTVEALSLCLTRADWHAARRLSPRATSTIA